MKRIAIGIDLGTTYSCVAAYVNGQVKIIPNEYDETCTPSVVSFTDDGEIVGKDARENATIDPTNTVYEIKRIMGRAYDDCRTQEDILRWPFKIENLNNTPCVAIKNTDGQKTHYRPEQISAKILEKMRKLAEDHLETEIVDAVITVPAHFNNAQKQATVDAGKIAGLNVLRILVEPTAAAIAYGEQKRWQNDDKNNILVYDLGGGTFDVSIVTIHGDKVEVRSTDGDAHLGGGDFDQRMVEHFLDDFKKRYPDDNVARDSKAMRRLAAKCESVKRQLSSKTLGDVQIDYFSEKHDINASITREKFEEINADYFAATIKSVEIALVGAFMQKKDIDDIILVGGSTRIPKVQEMLSKLFGGKDLKRNINPDEAVAYGAAILAAQLIGDQTLKMNISDVTSLSLGVGVVGNVFSVIIPKNTKIPTIEKANFRTAFTNQTTIHGTVYEGESPIASDNQRLGEYNIDDIPSGPKGAFGIRVKFAINNNGILKMRVKNKYQRKIIKLEMDYGHNHLSEEQIQSIIVAATKDREKNKQRFLKNQAKANLEVYCIEKQIGADSNVIDQCNTVLEWANNDQDSKSKQDFEKKLVELENLFGKISLPYE